MLHVVPYQRWVFLVSGHGHHDRNPHPLFSTMYITNLKSVFEDTRLERYHDIHIIQYMEKQRQYFLTLQTVIRVARRPQRATDPQVRHRR